MRYDRPFKADRIIFIDKSFVEKPTLAIKDEFIAVFFEDKDNIEESTVNLYNLNFVAVIENVKRIPGEDKKKQTIKYYTPEETLQMLRNGYLI